MEMFSELIHTQRHELGMTRVTAAKRLNFSYHKLFMLEHGVLRPPEDVEILKKFCELYGIPLKKLQLSIEHQKFFKQEDKKKMKEKRNGKIVRL